MKPILFTFAFAATLAAQNFIQMSDPQFGMFTKDASFEHETVNFEFAIATANRLKPAFVVITGDLIHSPVQCLETDWVPRPDFDPPQAAATRRAFLERYCERDTLALVQLTKFLQTRR